MTEFALVCSLIALFVALGIGFSLIQTRAELRRTLKELKKVSDKLAALEARVVAQERELSQLRRLPAKSPAVGPVSPFPALVQGLMGGGTVPGAPAWVPVAAVLIKWIVGTLTKRTGKTKA